MKLISKGTWSKTYDFLKRNLDFNSKLDIALQNAAELGLESLRNSTPVDTGLAASSWGYEIKKDRNSSTITWTNEDIESGYNVAILIQYGHGTGTGGYVQGRDFINPAIQPVFDSMIDNIWREVTR